MRQNDDSGARCVRENMVGTAHPVNVPPGPLEFAHQVGAGHVCMIHILGCCGKFPGVAPGTAFMASDNCTLRGQDVAGIHSARSYPQLRKFRS